MEIAQGLYITFFGMILVFSALGIIMLATIALERIFRPREVTVVEEKAPEFAEATTLEAVAGEDRYQIAAIAVAIALAQSEAMGGNGFLARGQDRRGPSPWVLHGRQAMMSGRELRGATWQKASK